MRNGNRNTFLALTFLGLELVLQHQGLNWLWDGNLTSVDVLWQEVEHRNQALVHLQGVLPPWGGSFVS